MTHSARRLTAPDGTVAAIDTMLVPLIEALWGAGYETVGSCQDLGESLKNYERKGPYWKGYAMLEMPVPDTLRLLDAIKDTPQFRGKMHWAAPGAWEVSLPIMSSFPFRGDRAAVTPWAQIHFPNDQLDDLVKVITAG